MMNLCDEPLQEELKQLGARISSIADPKLRRSKFVQLMSRIAEGQVTVEGDQLVEKDPTMGTDAAWGICLWLWQRLETAGSQIHNMLGAGGTMSDLVSDWLNEYDEYAPPTAAQRGWDLADFETDDEINRMFTFDGGNWGGIRPYEFSPDNPFVDHPNPLLRGIELFDAGELSDAILAFEAAAQRDNQVTQGSADALNCLTDANLTLRRMVKFGGGSEKLTLKTIEMTEPSPRSIAPFSSTLGELIASTIKCSLF